MGISRTVGAHSDFCFYSVTLLQSLFGGVSQLRVVGLHGCGRCGLDAARERYKDDGRRYPSDLTDAKWQTIKPVLSGYATLKGDLREIVNVRLYLEKAGCPWRFLPKEFGRAVADRADPAQTCDFARHDPFRADDV